MKKNRTTKKNLHPGDDLLPEYRFDYSKAKPNRFAARMKQGSRVVVIDPDVAQVFATAEAVNTILRALIGAMPQKSPASSNEA